MGTHLIPRSDVKGQDRFFIIFSVPGLIGTIIGIAIGFPFYLLFDSFGATFVGLIMVTIFGLIGFTIGQVKVPDTNAFPLFKKIGGEYIKTIIMRWFRFRKNKKKFVIEASSKQVFTQKEDRVEKIVMNKE
jgi:hypothetical protein